ncbi:MAG: c-type cytochrome biogenesis protein CcmI [Pseudomonadales bacterium]|nr:c-type cytochrome biogenesis protein CcmI [Pseudomonadales bacterium]
MEFYLIIAVLLVLSIALIIVLVLKRPRAVEDYYRQRIQRNIGIYKQRMAQLDGDLADEYISADDYQRSYSENVRQLIQSTEQFERAPLTASDHKLGLWLMMPVPLLALLIYSAIGAYPDWQIAQQMQALNAATSEAQYQSQLTAVYASIDQRLQKKPDQFEYRIMLARAAMAKQDYDRAVSHYAILAEMLPEDADALAYYAQAEYLRENRTITARVAEYLDKALKINPHQTTALGLLGISAFEGGDFVAAIAAWQKLSQVLDPGSQQAMMIQQGLDEARERLARENGADVEKVADNAVEGFAEKGIDINVSVAASLNHLDAGLSVFIYAKAAAGPPMPLAVKKLKLADLPLQLTLTDAMAMMPQMRLSQFKQVVVGARISFSGKPVAEKGDWQIESQAFNWVDRDRPVRLVISEKVQ